MKRGDKMPLGENLKNARESRNMTQKELAGRVQVNLSLIHI